MGREDVLAPDLCLGAGRQAQPLPDPTVSARPDRRAGLAGLGTAQARLAAIRNE